MPQIDTVQRNTVEYWDGLYSRHEYPTLGAPNRDRYQVAAAQQRGGSALDLGCGQGGLGLILLRRQPKLFYVGVDQSAAALQSNVLPLDLTDHWLLVRSAIEALNPDWRAATVYCCELVEHVADPAALLADAAARAEQRLVLTVPTFGHPYQWHRGEHLWDFQEDEVRALLAP